MKKQTISKIAALSLAAMTAVPMVGIGASADIITNRGDASTSTQQSISGTAFYLEWYTTQNTKNYTVIQDPITLQCRVEQVGSDINSFYNDEGSLVDGLGENGAGHEFYGYSNIKPADYQRLVDAATRVNKENADGEAAIRKAIANYNSDKTKYDNTVKTIENNPILYKGTANERYNSITYTDTMNNTVVVTHNGSAAVATKNNVAYNGPVIADYASIASVTPGMSFPIAKFEVKGTPQTLNMSQLSAKIGGSYVTVANETGIIDLASPSPTAWYINTGAADLGNNGNAGNNTDVSGIASSATYSSTYPWYSTSTKRYYKSKQEAVAASGGVESFVILGSSSSPTINTTIPSSSTYSVTYPYYSTATKKYYRTYAEGVTASGGLGSVYDATPNYAVDYRTSYSSTYHYYSSLTRRYYRTWSDAVTDSNGVSSYVSDATPTQASSSTYSSTYPWYSSYTRRYYQTYSAALAASNNNASYVSQGNYYYNDPYYYYYYGLGGLGNYGLGNNSNTTKDTSSVTIGNLKGWNSVTKTINSAKSGSAYTVNMKNESEIPSSVLSALKGKNVDVNFKFSNGAVVTLNGTDINSTSSISPVVKYGQTSIPSSLKKKAVSSNDGISSSQFTVNGGSLGADASVTVKFNSKRSGCSAKLYRYNASDNTLSLVSRSAVQSNGQVKFDNVKQGGEYIVVLS